jgi:hypothetical protein
VYDIPSWWWFKENFLPPQAFNPYPRHDPINYGTNSYGYRCPEFNTIDWGNSYVMLGSSDIFGSGVEDDETISQRLQELLGIPVINLGFSAASNQHILLVMSMLARLHRPKKWIVCWSDNARWLHWDSKTTDPIKVQAHRGPHKEFCGDPYPQLLESLSWYSSQSRIAAQAISNNNMIEFGFSHTPILKEWGVKFFEMVDISRDQGHPGPQTNKIIAQWIYDEINKQS